MEFVAVDDGYGETKVCADSGARVFPSRGKVLSTMLDVEPSRHGAAKDLVYSVGQELVQINPFIRGDDTCYEGYHTSTLNAALVHHAITTCGYSGAIALAVGLPPALYFEPDGEVNRSLIEAKRASLMRPAEVFGQGCAYHLAEVQVYPQSVSAWLYHAISPEGLFKQQSSPVAVVDVGARKTEVVLIEPPTRINLRVSRTLGVGTFDAHKKFRAAMRQSYGIEDCPAHYIDFALGSGKYIDDFHQQAFDVSAVIRELKGQMTDEIEFEIKQVLASFGDVNELLLCGTGQAFLPELQKRFVGAEISKSPGFDNVRGMLKFLKFGQAR